MTARSGVRWRYRVWAGWVVGFAVVDPVACGIALESNGFARPAAAIVTALDAALLLLIVTTPVDAVRLPVRRSLVLIAGLTGWTWAVQSACFDRGAAGLAAACLSPVVAWTLADAAARRGRTPWWAGVLLWSPATLGPAAGPLAWSCAGAGVLIVLLRLYGRLADRSALR